MAVLKGDPAHLMYTLIMKSLQLLYKSLGECPALRSIREYAEDKCAVDFTFQCIVDSPVTESAGECTKSTICRCDAMLDIEFVRKGPVYV